MIIYLFLCFLYAVQPHTHTVCKNAPCYVVDCTLKFSTHNSTKQWIFNCYQIFFIFILTEKNTLRKIEYCWGKTLVLKNGTSENGHTVSKSGNFSVGCSSRLCWWKCRGACVLAKSSFLSLPLFIRFSTLSCYNFYVSFLTNRLSEVSHWFNKIKISVTEALMRWVVQGNLRVGRLYDTVDVIMMDCLGTFGAFKLWLLLSEGV